MVKGGLVTEIRFPFFVQVAEEKERRSQRRAAADVAKGPRRERDGSIWPTPLQPAQQKRTEGR